MGSRRCMRPAKTATGKPSQCCCPKTRTPTKPPRQDCCRCTLLPSTETPSKSQPLRTFSNEDGLCKVCASYKTPFRIVSLLVPVTSRARLRHSCVSPLHLAAERNRHAAAAVLLKTGADVNATLACSRSLLYADRRATALYIAVASGGTETAEVLLNAGASLTLDPVSPLLMAVRQGSVRSVSLLLERGADANTSISSFTTFPTAVALCMNNLPLLKCLLDNGCDALSCFACTRGRAPHTRPEESRPGNLISGHIFQGINCGEPPGRPVQVGGDK